jgi:secreted PhoX family phosphatase
VTSSVRPADRSVAADRPLRGRLAGPTRRDFIRGIAAAGASTAGAVALRGTGLDLFAEEALAARGRNRFGDFTAIAASSADAFEVPRGFRADVLISWGDTFRDGGGQALHYGFNNDFLAYFPLRGSREGLLFVNHEYPDPFFIHGYKPTGGPKTPAQVQQEQDAVGNSILHVGRRRNGWKVISPSKYNRRIYGDRPSLEFTGPLAGAAGIGTTANGSLGNCSGGVTPWGTAISCEENFDDYGLPVAANVTDQFGWPQFGGRPEDAEYDHITFAKYGWVCEHDPYDPGGVGRKHTALGRFRHENAAFRHEPGKRFVVYMGDDKTNEGVYKFVSERSLRRRDIASNRQILEAGQLYIARWEPEGRRRFATAGDTTPLSATEGTGTWVPVLESELDDTATKLRARFAADYDTFFATNRPEDLEVAEDGSVFIALTNNGTVNDSHGAVRRLRERGNDPEALEFTWLDYAAGGPTGSGDPGTAGFSSPDNLVFDKAGNLWVVTDISSSRLNRTNPANEYTYHGNNAMFMVPTSGPNRGVAFRFANGPVECEITGPYFTPNEDTFFVNVQHPGENTAGSATSPAVFGDETTYTSWWPEGNRTANEDPSTPKPSTVVITRAERDDDDEDDDD